MLNRSLGEEPHLSRNWIRPLTGFQLFGKLEIETIPADERNSVGSAAQLFGVGLLSFFECFTNVDANAFARVWVSRSGGLVLSFVNSDPGCPIEIMGFQNN